VVLTFQPIAMEWHATPSGLERSSGRCFTSCADGSL